MEYQCGNCGVPLDDAALDSGMCPSCSTHISPFGDVLESLPQQMAAHHTMPAPPNDPTILPDVQRAFADDRLVATHARLASIRTSRATGRLADPIGAPSLRTPTAGLLVGIGIAVVMVLLCTLATTSTLLSGFTGSASPQPTKAVLRVTPGPTSPIIGIGFPTQNPNPTPLPYLQNTPTFEPTSTPFGGPPTPTPSPSPSPPVTVTPGGPGGVLQVNPTNFPTQCPNGKAAFTVTNFGLGPLNWNATSVLTQDIQPNNGTLNPGGNVTVKVRGIPNSGSITFSDVNNTSQPVTVQVSC